MTTSINEALVLTLAMALAIFFCRIFPFLFFHSKTDASKDGAIPGRGFNFLGYVEKTVPPVAMTVLAFNSLASPIEANPREIIPIFIAAALTAALHLWRRNPLMSIFGGTGLYMVILRIFS